MKRCLLLLLLMFCRVASAQVDPAPAAQFVRQYAAHYRVPPELLAALIDVESRWNARALSSKGAMGLMQLMPETARRYGAFSGNAHVLGMPLNTFMEFVVPALAVPFLILFKYGRPRGYPRIIFAFHCLPIDIPLRSHSRPFDLLCQPIKQNRPGISRGSSETCFLTIPLYIDLFAHVQISD
jgi:hypothetical protein